MIFDFNIFYYYTVCFTGSKGAVKLESENYTSKNIERYYYCYFTLTNFE